MIRFPAFSIALALAAPAVLLRAPAQANDRALPMRFELRRRDPAKPCGHQCGAWIVASGAITADTPRDFRTSPKAATCTALTVALDSDGGSVLGAIGSAAKSAGSALNTTVGRGIDLDTGDGRAPYATLSPRADCQSMCAFVLLAGVHRTVPREARVMVHQIWLGDRRDDPTAANYSAEDLVLVQHDIGSLAQYTVEMGARSTCSICRCAFRRGSRCTCSPRAKSSRMHVATDLPPPIARRRRLRLRRRRGVDDGAAIAPMRHSGAADRDQRTALGHGRSRRRRRAGAAPSAHHRRRGDRQLRSHASPAAAPTATT